MSRLAEFRIMTAEEIAYYSAIPNHAWQPRAPIKPVDYRDRRGKMAPLPRCVCGVKWAEHKS
jgi:hypothetical protein